MLNLGGTANFRLIRPKNNGMDQSFLFSKRRKTYVRCKNDATKYRRSTRKTNDSGVKKETLVEFMELDENRRKLLVKSGRIEKYRNDVSAEIAQLKRAKRRCF